MTELLFQTDSYIRVFDATITSLDNENHGVVLDLTAFFPGGGGQPCDQGTIHCGNTTFSVIRTRKIAGQIVHELTGDRALPVANSPVHAQIDWQRRYSLMRTHTAMHILCGVIFRDYGASVTGGDMTPLRGRMDFEFEAMHKELVVEIERAINQEVQNCRAVRVNILPREQAFQIPDLIRTKVNLLPEGINEIRVVEIVGLDLQADGGTHVNNTSEVEPIRIADYKSKGKSNKRIYIELSE